MANLQSLLNPMSSGPPSPVALIGQHLESPPAPSLLNFSPDPYPQDEPPAAAPSPPPPSPPPRSPSPMETSPIAPSTSETDTDNPPSPHRTAPAPKKPAPKKRGLAKPTTTTKKPKKPPRHKPTTTTTTTTTSSSSSDQLYCICRAPDTGKWMIGCDGCEEWYHGDCVHVREADSLLIDKYICANCAASGDAHTTWKRMCRLPGCRLPALVPSKYCSPDHGERFFTDALRRATMERGEVAALVAAAGGVGGWKMLGSGIPEGVGRGEEGFSDEEIRRLGEIADEKDRLEVKGRSIERRGLYLAYAVERKKREGGVAVCGYDERFALDDVEWEEFCEGEEGKTVFQTAEIAGRDGMCVQKRNCKKHMNWHALLAEEQVVGERIRKERVQALKTEERKIRERRKRRAVKDEREGVVEMEC